MMEILSTAALLYVHENQPGEPISRTFNDSLDDLFTAEESAYFFEQGLMTHLMQCLRRHP